MDIVWRWRWWRAWGWVVCFGVMFALAGAALLVAQDLTEVSTPSAQLAWEAPPEVASASRVGPSAYGFRVYIDDQSVALTPTCIGAAPVTCVADGVFAAVAPGPHVLRMSTTFLAVEGRWSDPIPFVHVATLPGPPVRIEIRPRIQVLINGQPVTVFQEGVVPHE